MPEVLLTAQELAEVQQNLAGAATTLSAVPAVGGMIWNVTKAGTGDGIHTRPGADVPVGEIVANVYTNLPPPQAMGLALALAGEQVPQGSYWLVADDAFNASLRSGYKVASDTEPDPHTYSIAAVYRLPGFTVARLLKPGA